MSQGGAGQMWLGGYGQQSVAFLSRHGKQTLVAPVLERAWGCKIVHTEAFDTDRLGTFTREVDRPGSQMEAVRRKARMGMALLGLPIIWLLDPAQRARFARSRGVHCLHHAGQWTEHEHGPQVGDRGRASPGQG